MARCRPCERPDSSTLNSLVASAPTVGSSPEHRNPYSYAAEPLPYFCQTMFGRRAAGHDGLEYLRLWGYCVNLRRTTGAARRLGHQPWVVVAGFFSCYYQLYGGCT